MMHAICQFMKEEEGATAAEYALLLALITVALIGTVKVLSNAIGGAMTAAATAINGGS